MSTHSPPRASSMANPHYSSPGSPPAYGLVQGSPNSQYNAFPGNTNYNQGSSASTPGGAGHASVQQSPPGYPSQVSAYNAPVVSVTDYGSTSPYSPSNYRGMDHSPYPGPNDGGTGNNGYEQEYTPPPTDFDALFSGKSAPSIMVTGSDHAAQLTSQKANKLLGIRDPNSLVYENSGFSRTVHFDVNNITEFGEEDEYYQAEVHAKKRRGFLPHFMTFDKESESVANIPKKSKSIFVSKSKMNKQDRWLEWSEKMRVEAQIKREEFVKKQEEAAKNQLPPPIRKARKESVKFGNRHLPPVDEETPLSKAILDMEQTLPAKPLKAMSKQQSRDKYTVDQWQKLHEYWDHSLFQITRPLGYIIAWVVMAAAIPPLLSCRWIRYNVTIPTNFTYTLQPNQTFFHYEAYNCSTVNVNGTCYETYKKFSHIEHHGLWYNCTDNLTSFSGISDPECKPMNRTGIYGWQSAIIGLLLFSLAAGFLASILTTCGVCSTSLAKKVYYYHSAGEIFFVCGVCSMSALITYLAVLEKSSLTPIHKYGVGYYLAWGMPFCYYASAFFMTLDDMIHSITNDCCLFCRRKDKTKQASYTQTAATAAATVAHV